MCKEKVQTSKCPFLFSTNFVLFVYNTGYNSYQYAFIFKIIKYGPATVGLIEVHIKGVVLVSIRQIKRFL